MRLRVDVWSDIACPWCYVGKRRFEAALARFEAQSEVDVVWHAFELDPAAPREHDASATYAERLARKYGSSLEEAQSRLDHLTELGRAEGIELCFERVHAGNTFDAHRLLAFALTQGRQGELKERLLRAYFSEGEAIGRPATLVRLAAEVGLDEGACNDVLSGGGFADEVRADEQQAARFAIHAVPCFVVAEQYAVSGAHPSAQFEVLLRRAWAEVKQG